MSGPSCLLYRNKLIGSTIIASAEDVDTFKENAIDRYFYSCWKDSVSSYPYIEFDLGSALDIDCIGLFGLEEDSTSDFNWWLYAGSSTDPTNLITSGTMFANESIFKSFISANHRYWRLLLSGPANLVNIMLGEKLILERGMERDWLRPTGVDDDEYYELFSEDGFPLGKSIEQSGKKLVLGQSDISHGFFHDYWLPLVDYAYGDLDEDNYGNFYASWNEADYPREAIYCVSDRTPAKQDYTDQNGTNVKFKIIGYGEVTSAALPTPPTPPVISDLIPLVCVPDGGPLGDGSIYDLGTYCYGFFDAWVKAPIEIDALEIVTDLYTLETFNQIDALEIVNII